MNSENKQRILIVGLPKSGTTILTYRISAALKNAKIFFEPGKQKGLSDVTIHQDISNHPSKISVTKSLFIPIEGYDIETVAKFYDKKIWIYRDPRDWIISRYLYKWKHLDNMQISKFCDRLKNKELNPSIVPFYDLMTPNFIKTSLFNYSKLVEVLNNLEKDWFVIKYEDFIDNNYDEINSYLGRELDPAIEVAKKYNRVVRSKSYGNWKTWFNIHDVRFFRTKINHILKALNYKPIDWAIDNPEKIDSNLGSDYVKKLHSSKLKM